MKAAPSSRLVRAKLASSFTPLCLSCRILTDHFPGRSSANFFQVRKRIDPESVSWRVMRVTPFWLNWTRIFCSPALAGMKKFIHRKLCWPTSIALGEIVAVHSFLFSPLVATSLHRRVSTTTTVSFVDP